MAVLVEALSVIVRRDAINKKFRGAWQQFVNEVPNASLCYDDDLARVGFMTPGDVEKYLERLIAQGLVVMVDGKFGDCAVVDQREGPTMHVDWLSVARVSIDSRGSEVVACWLIEGPPEAAAVSQPAGRRTLSKPVGWTYERSLSANFSFVPKDQMQEKWKFLRSEGANDVYLDQTTGKELFVGRSALK
jgi:hypothetical protein